VMHVAGAGLVDDDGYSYQDIEDHAAHQLDIEIAPTITFPHITRTRTVTPPLFSTEQQITFPHIERTRAITPPSFVTAARITFPHITRGGYGNYQAGYGDGRIGIMTFSTPGVASLLFIPPDSATQKSPTLTADFARNHPTSIFHWMPAKPRQVHVLKEDGVYTNYEIITTQQTQDADVVYLGGHRYEIDADEAADLVAAGYTVTLVPDEGE
ncbi:MAG: hypothetical protein GY698_21460, partial [Actinomycetia bacterium]|nr:hypothetical protein [Actinomycetes bacterium]